MSDIKNQLKNLVFAMESILKTMDDEGIDLKFSSESDFDSLVLKIKRIIGKAPGKKVGKRDLLRKLKIKVYEMNEALDTMIQSGQIESIYIYSNTNKKTVYTLIDNI